MPYTITMLKLRDYAEWKSGFDAEEGAALRKDAGMKSYRILKTERDPNQIMLMCEWDSLDTARTHIRSEGLRQIHEQLGLSETPETHYLEEVEKGTV